MTLYDKLKPHIKDKLEAHYEEYSTAVGYISNKLKKTESYSDLKVDDIRTIHTFTDLWYRDIDSLDLIYGDHLFNQTL